MASPSVSDGGKQSPTPNGDGESSQDSNLDVKIKDEPADSGYEPVPPSENQSSSNSRASSPQSSAKCDTASPSQDPERSSSPQAEGQQEDPLNDTAGSSIRSQLQTSTTGKKVDTVQNIVEGLLKKNASLLAMSDAGGLRPNSRRAKGLESIKRGEINTTQSGSTVFPISSVSQARLVSSQGHAIRRGEYGKNRLLRPKSPTRRCETILSDDTQMSYALMEATVGDPEVENIFRVQHHELVCAISLKSYVTDKEKKIIAVLDNNYYWCNFCSFSSTNKDLLTQHIMDHRFRCSHCPYESFCRSDIVRHTSVAHSEMTSPTESLSYCSFLSDYLRVKSRCEKLEQKLPCTDPDDDVDDFDKDEMQAALLKAEKRRKEEDIEIDAIPQKRARVDERKSSDSSDRPGKSRKSLNPRRHPQPSENDYETFEMEVEEINDYVENGNEHDNERGKVMYPSHMTEDIRKQTRPIHSPQPSMQVIPSIQEGGKQGFTTTHITNTVTPRLGRPTKTPCPFNKTKRTSGSSSLYWSCGYCDFQSSSQAEIKEHSNRSHPGNPHRFNKKVSSSKSKPSKPKAVLVERIPHHHGNVKGTNGDSAGDSEKTAADASEKSRNICHDSYVHNQTPETSNQGFDIDNALNECLSESESTSVELHKALSGKQEVEGSFEKSSSLIKSDHTRYFAGVGSLAFKDSQYLPVSPKSITVKHNEEVFETLVSESKSAAESKESPEKSRINSLNFTKEDTCKKDSYEESTSVDLSSPSLKLTFKTIGQITTCSINDKDSSKEELVSIPIQKQNLVNPGKESAEWEYGPMDSTDESDLDMCSNPRSIALSVSSISEIFDNSISSPQPSNNGKDLDVGIEPENAGGDQKQTTAESERKCEKSQGEPVCNENLIKLSPPCGKRERPSQVMSLTCVPARSAAVKAMNKMKPIIETDVETLGGSSSQTQSGWSDGNKQPARSGTTVRLGFGKLSQSTLSAASDVDQSKSVVQKSVYSCHHCNEMKTVTLPKIRIHLSNQHPDKPPIVINVRQMQNGKKKRKLFICPFPGCKRLLKSTIDLDYHKKEHASCSTTKPKERKTMNSLSTSSISSISQVLATPSSVPRGRENISNCCVKLHQLNMSQLSQYRVTPAAEKNETGGFECLYCTDNVTCNTLSDMKQHHFSEHPSQLLVVRDVQAKRSQLPSRIYLCDDTGCDFRSSCRNDILSHSGCHNANCTSVFECPSCGWYSSSYRVAEEHVKHVHADEENISLIRMQLSVNENGQTSKKILR